MADTISSQSPSSSEDFTPASLKHHISWKGAPGSEMGDIPDKKCREEGERTSASKIESETELQRWERVLVGKQFVLDTESSLPLWFKPEDDSIQLPEKKRFIFQVTEEDYNRKRLSICLDMQYKVKSVYFG